MAGAMKEKMSGMAGMGCEKMTGAMTEGKMTGATERKNEWNGWYGLWEDGRSHD